MRQTNQIALGGESGLATEDTMDPKHSYPPYVLVTPARNEAAFIEKTIESVIHQTVLPAKWVIVNDGSTDATGTIAEKYATSHDWIEVVNRPVRKERNFAAKVNAFNAGQERLKNVEYEIIGNLDSDVAFDKDHFEFLLSKFKEDDRLGVAGTVFKEEGGYSSENNSFEGKTTFPVSARCSDAAASTKLAGISRMRAGPSIGLQSPPPE